MVKTSGGGAHILVVDDSDEIREFYRLIFEQAGYRVSTAPSGLEALRALRQDDRPALVITDVFMPGMDGLELLGAMRSDLAPPLPLSIVCSGFDVAREEAMRRGALRFLRKPVDPKLLLGVVERALRGPAGAAAPVLDESVAAAERIRAVRTAEQFVARILDRLPDHERGAAYARWIASYFSVSSAFVILMRPGGLFIRAASGSLSERIGEDLPAGGLRGYCEDIVASAASLLVPDAAASPWFEAGDPLLEVRFLVGVPFVTPEGVGIGALCLVDPRPRRLEAEDLLILEQIGRSSSELLSRIAAGGVSELPVPGVVPADLFDLLLDMELRLASRHGDGVALSLLRFGEGAAGLAGAAAIRKAMDMARLAVGVDGAVVSVFHRAHDPAETDDSVRQAIGIAARQGHPPRAAGIAALATPGVQPLSARELCAVARAALRKAMAGGALRAERVALHTDAWSFAPR